MTDSTSTSPASSSSATGIALGACIALVVLLIAGVAAVFLLRRRRRRFTKLQETEAAGRPSVVLDRSHPAARVTPFTPGREPDYPRFARSPGENMRIARRRSDGGWEFSTPLPSGTLPEALRPPDLPFSPGHWHTQSAHSCSSRCSSPTVSSLTLIGTHGNASSKDKKVPGELTTRGFVEPEIDVDELVPPPAYSPRRFSSRASHGYSHSTHF